MQEHATTILFTLVRTFVVVALFASATPGTALASRINLTLQDAPLTVLKQNSLTKKINGIPLNTPGRIELDIKWHAMTLIPMVFTKLKVELLHGSSVLVTKECYSVHSPNTPRCELFAGVDQAEASAPGDWKLRVTNNSNHDANGFNILREATDLNPAVIAMIVPMASFFEADCSARSLRLFGATPITIGPSATVESSFATYVAGEVHIKAKWHTDTIIPNVFKPLKVEVLFNGTVIKSDFGYSIHAGKLSKLNIRFNASANQSGTWKLRVTNNHETRLTGFDIEKGNDANPFVPNFKSIFTPSCN